MNHLHWSADVYTGLCGTVSEWREGNNKRFRKTQESKMIIPAGRRVSFSTFMLDSLAKPEHYNSAFTLFFFFFFPINPVLCWAQWEKGVGVAWRCPVSLGGHCHPDHAHCTTECVNAWKVEGGPREDLEEFFSTWRCVQLGGGIKIIELHINS